MKENELRKILVKATIYYEEEMPVDNTQNDIHGYHNDIRPCFHDIYHAVMSYYNKLEEAGLNRVICDNIYRPEEITKREYIRELPDDESYFKGKK